MSDEGASHADNIDDNSADGHEHYPGVGAGSAGPSSSTLLDGNPLMRRSAMRSSQLQRHRPYSLVGSLTDPNVRMHLRWRDVQFSVTQQPWWNSLLCGTQRRQKRRTQRHILQGISGEARPGQVSRPHLCNGL
jgi:hypothetical protein